MGSSRQGVSRTVPADPLGARASIEAVEVGDAYLAAETEVMRTLLVDLRARYGSAEAYVEAHGLEPEAIAAFRDSLSEE